MMDPPSASAAEARQHLGAGDPESASHALAEPYSPQLRTALVLTGTGTAGAYHAGVLRALHEAGVKIDIVAGHGIGVVGALFAACDGAQRLWDEKGFWSSPAIRNLYPWRTMLRIFAWAVALSIAIVAIPIGAIALGLVVYPIDFLLKMMGLGGAGNLIGAYSRFTQTAFAAEALPTWLPRLVVLVLGLVGVMAFVSGSASRDIRRHRGPWWWRILRPPLSSAQAAHYCWSVMWDLLRGAAQLKEPTPIELGRRFIELVGENLGQPGFRELVLAVHDLDAHRDLIFTLVPESRRRDLYRRAAGRSDRLRQDYGGPPKLYAEAEDRPLQSTAGHALHGGPGTTLAEAEERRAEVFDLSGVARDYLPDIVAGALAIPVASEPGAVRFAADAFWRGETHRVCDRPASVARVIEEVTQLGAGQVLLVSAAPEAHGPHALSPPRLDGRGRFGQYLQSAEAAAVRDATRAAVRRSVRIFPIRPAHNPIGPFDFAGAFDDRSDRVQPLEELMARGYEDAYRQFIEPIVGASGERVGQIES